MNSFRFTTPEYYHRHKTADWFWAVGIIAVSGAATAVIFNNILLAVLIVLGAFSLSMYAARQPEENDIEVSNAGITVGKFRFSFSSLESFWIEESTHPRLLVKTSRVVMPHIIIPIDSLSETEKEELREFLKSKIPEVEQTEPLLEQVMEYIGF